MRRTYLGEFEEIVLLITAMLEGSAYGVSITHEIVRQTNRSVRLNQVHDSLQRLEDKGMIISKMGDPTPERGGRRKRIFTVTAYGRQTCWISSQFAPMRSLLASTPLKQAGL